MVCVIDSSAIVRRHTQPSSVGRSFVRSSLLFLAYVLCFSPRVFLGGGGGVRAIIAFGCDYSSVVVVADADSELQYIIDPKIRCRELFISDAADYYNVSTLR